MDRIVHIGNDSEEVGIGDLARLILRVGGHEPQVEWLPTPQGSVARRSPDLTMLRELTGHDPAASRESRVRRTFESYRDTERSGPLDARWTC